MSFIRENSGGKKLVEHSTPLPEGVLERKPSDSWGEGSDEEEWSPFISKRAGILNYESPDASSRKTRQWMRARGKISPAGGHEAHLSALAYMSDSYFIGTVARIHNLLRGPITKEDGDGRDQIGMMVSLDHSIFFHEPRGFRADEWMFTECESPWAGDGRGAVMQKMWGSDGRLVATCFQEGVVRLKQMKEEEKAKL